MSKVFQPILDFFAAEPVVVIGVVTAALVLAANYGLPVGGQHADDIKNLISAGLVLLGAYAARSQVVPTPADLPPAPAAPAASSATPASK